MIQRVFIGLGSNLQSPLQQLQQALSSIELIPHTRLLAVSPFYGSTAVGAGQQPDYVNAAALLTTRLTPLNLLDQLQAIEAGQGRVRGPEQWVPRTLDLDILLVDDQIIASERLTVPHPQISVRSFVLKPLLDLDSELVLPDGRPLAELLAALPEDGLWPLPQTEEAPGNGASAP